LGITGPFHKVRRGCFLLGVDATMGGNRVRRTKLERLVVAHTTLFPSSAPRQLTNVVGIWKRKFDASLPTVRANLCHVHPVTARERVGSQKRRIGNLA
jgi:hypothetical protein